jgi:hypothetical protein
MLIDRQSIDKEKNSKWINQDAEQQEKKRDQKVD